MIYKSLSLESVGLFDQPFGLYWQSIKTVTWLLVDNAVVSTNLYDYHKRYYLHHSECCAKILGRSGVSFESPPNQSRELFNLLKRQLQTDMAIYHLSISCQLRTTDVLAVSLKKRKKKKKTTGRTQILFRGSGK